MVVVESSINRMVGASAPAKVTVFWFRKGLRLHDNPALAAAIGGASHLLPVFCLDPWFVSSGKVGANRLHFLLESLVDLDCRLRALNSRLIVLRGQPDTEIPRALQAWRAERLVFEMDTESYSRARDRHITSLAKGMGVEVDTRWGHTLCDLESLLKRHPGGKPTTTYSSFLNHLDKELRAAPITIVDTPTALPSIGDGIAPAELSACVLPSVAELGLDQRSTSVILRGGETEALKRMEAHLARTEWVAAFEKPATSPTQMDPFGEKTRSTTVLSPYLKFGCLSARTFHKRLSSVYASHPKHSKPPTSLHGQLYWREFYYTCALGTPNYEKMVGNPICRQIDWDDDDEKLAAWKQVLSDRSHTRQ